MKTTIEIPDALLAEAKALAAREKTTLRSLVEQGLRVVLDRGRPAPRRQMRDGSVGGDGLTPEFEAQGGWSRLREAAYPDLFDDEPKSSLYLPPKKK